MTSPRIAVLPLLLSISLAGCTEALSNLTGDGDHPPYPPAAPFLQSVTHANGRFVARGPAVERDPQESAWAIMTSTDGNKWENAIVPGVVAEKLSQPVFADGRWAIAAELLDGSVVMLTSVDALTWTILAPLPDDGRSFPSGLTYQLLAANGILFLSNGNATFRSTDGVAWNMLAGLDERLAKGSLYSTGDALVAINEWDVAVSADGVSWSHYRNAGLPEIRQLVKHGAAMVGHGGYDSSGRYRSVNLIVFRDDQWTTYESPYPIDGLVDTGDGFVVNSETELFRATGELGAWEWEPSVEPDWCGDLWGSGEPASDGAGTVVTVGRSICVSHDYGRTWTLVSRFESS